MLPTTNKRSLGKKDPTLLCSLNVTETVAMLKKLDLPRCIKTRGFSDDTTAHVEKFYLTLLYSDMGVVCVLQ